MERLTYNRYKCSDNIITIDLHNGFTIICLKMWNHENGYYEIEYRITENTIDKWDFINDEPVIIKADYKTINSAILKDVADKVRAGYFKPYEERCSYELLCFEKGNDFFEQERLHDTV